MVFKNVIVYLQWCLLNKMCLKFGGKFIFSSPSQCHNFLFVSDLGFVHPEQYINVFERGIALTLSVPR